MSAPKIAAAATARVLLRSDLRTASSLGASRTSAHTPRRGRAVTCSRCGSVYKSAAWPLLSLAHVLGPEDVGRVVLGWPSDEVVEVRVCTTCRGLISATCGGGGAP